MKKTFTLILSIFFYLPLSAQFVGLPCGADEANEALLEQHPELAIGLAERQEAFYQYFNSKDHSQNRSASTTIIIPVVFHVVHNNGNGNLTDAQIQASIDRLNDAFQKKHADTGLIRSIFKPIAGSMDIEFRLAKIDPQGNCTNGIVRVNSTVTGFSGAGGDPLRIVSPTWNSGSRVYYNIWTTTGIGSASGGGVAGFSYRPSSGAPASLHGTTIIYTYISNPVTGFDVLAHETGHALDLHHPFNFGCSGTGDCTSNGDRICDTPDQPNSVFACSAGINTCSVDHVGGTTGNPNPFTSDPPDMIENYMGYNQGGPICSIMFTQGQVNHMTDAITSGLWPYMTTMGSASNNVATGTDDAFWPTAPPCAPVADFSSNINLVCGSANVNFFDESYNAAVDTSWSWSWSFPGGTPSSSSLQDPVVNYSSPGVYNVTLTTSNSTGSSQPVTKFSFIEVKNGTGAFGLVTEEFSDPQFPFTDPDPEKTWSITQEPSNVIKWGRSTTAFYSSPSSIFLNQAFVPGGNENYLTSPGYDVSSVSDSLFLRYALAHAPSSGGGNDLLRIQVSDDCGSSWTTEQNLFSLNIYTNGGATANNFTPSDQSEWEIRTLDLSAYAGKSKIQIRFLARSGGHNNFWIDDVGLYQGSLTKLEKITDIDFVQLFPNPSTGELNISFTLFEDSEVKYSLVDRVGKEIELFTIKESAGDIKKEFDLSGQGVTKGIYILRIESNKGSIASKLIIQ